MPYKKVLKNSVLKKITDHIVFKRFEYLNMKAQRVRLMRKRKSRVPDSKLTNVGDFFYMLTDNKALTLREKQFSELEFSTRWRQKACTVVTKLS